MEKKPYVLGIGSVNADLMGRSKNPLVPEDSNPGRISISVGGATHNACENAVRLGAAVNFITATGDDYFGDVIKSACRKAGLSTDNFITFPGKASSTYMSVHNTDGEMNIAVSDMSVLQNLTPSHLEDKRQLLENATAITFDTGLPQEIINYIIDNYSKKTAIFADPVSTTYAQKLVGHLSGIHTLKPNRLEAEILSGRKIDSNSDLAKAAGAILSKGVRRVFISLGRDGVYYQDADGKSLLRKTKPLDEIANATGAGDAFLGALLYSYVNGFDIEETLTTATTTSLLTILSDCTINPDMSLALVEEYKERFKE